MNIQAPPTFWSFICQLHASRDVCFRLVAREVSQRFRGSMLGIFWAFLTPLLAAAIFTLVFTGILPSRWPGRSGGSADFALMLLVGLAMHGTLAEVLSRSPMLIVSNPSYVTKVVFPLEILPVVATIAALANMVITLIIVILGQVFVNGVLYWTIIFFPFVVLPYIIFIVAMAMILSAIGVFVRDLAQFIGPFVMLLMFIAPVFYPVEILPENLQLLVQLNPVTLIIEETRVVLLYGQIPDFFKLSIYSAVAISLLIAAQWIFRRLRVGFADVL